MLDLSSQLVTWAVPFLIGIVITIIIQVDSSNDHASGPIPVANHM